MKMTRIDAFRISLVEQLETMQRVAFECFWRLQSDLDPEPGIETQLLQSVTDKSEKMLEFTTLEIDRIRNSTSIEDFPKIDRERMDEMRKDIENACDELKKHYQAKCKSWLN
jgi:hypothetical protein